MPIYQVTLKQEKGKTFFILKIKSEKKLYTDYLCNSKSRNIRKTRIYKNFFENFIINNIFKKSMHISYDFQNELNLQITRFEFFVLYYKFQKMAKWLKFNFTTDELDRFKDAQSMLLFSRVNKEVLDKIGSILNSIQLVKQRNW